MKCYFIILSMVLASLIQAGEMPDADTQAAAAEARFVDRMNGLMVPKPPPSGRLLFTREETYGDCEQIVEISQEVYDQLVSQRPPYVDFNHDALVPFDRHGVCSAMSLDFLARYDTECSNISNADDRAYCISQFRPYLRMYNDTFMSRQSAYNTIKVDQEVASEDPELVKAQKMQSLANFHHISLKPVTKSMSISDIENGTINLEKIVNNLTDGNYVVRALYPEENHKMERFGHTMIVIKNKKLSIFFDPTQGAKVLPQKLGKAVVKELINWAIPEVRFYQATAQRGGYINISTQMTD